MVGVVVRSDNSDLDTVIAQVVDQHESCPAHTVDRAKRFCAQQNSLALEGGRELGQIMLGILPRSNERC